MRTAGILLLLLLGCSFVRAVDREWQGQVSGWFGMDRSEDEIASQGGLRYIPQGKLTFPLESERFVDAEVAMHALAFLTEDGSSTDLDPYRLTCRFATAQTETTLGLQKLNFGAARLLRPLRWFDRLDPRDPLQFTEGVYGLRFRYNTLGNSSLWLWSLLGNDEPKGYERVGSDPRFPEIGGRIQRPAGPGELALTLHTRRIDPHASTGEFEGRIGLDGRWDLGVGFWFEGFVQRLWGKREQDDHFCMLTVGIDYTFGFGNGVYLLAEQMVISASGEGEETDRTGHVSGVLVNYPLGLFDALQFILYRTWKHHASMEFVQWQRSYDRLSLALSFYRASAPGAIPGQTGFGVLTSGFGGQALAIWYY